MPEEKQLTTEDLKRILEDTAKESGLKITGEIAILKTDEQREAEKEIQEWKEDKTKFQPLKEFKIPEELINCLFTTNQYHGFLMLGEGGLGKTILTLTSVKMTFEPEDWEYSSGYTTPLALYEFLYNNRNKKVIVLDDVEGVFNNQISLSILKGALWESDGKRICQYSSKSDKANMPEKFIMNSKIIILCNHIPKENDVSTRATLSRVLSYKLEMTFNKKMEICKNFIIKDESIDKIQKELIFGILDKNVSEATKDFNFRTLRKLIAFVRYNPLKAEYLFKATTEKDEDKEAYLQVIKDSSIVSVQIKLFVEKTGRSRATFFRTKKSIIVSKKRDMIQEIKK